MASYLPHTEPHTPLMSSNCYKVPTLQDFFKAHPLIHPKTFLGNAAFDSVGIYKALLTGNTFGDNKHFSTAYIPLNSRSLLENIDYKINADGIRIGSMI